MAEHAEEAVAGLDRQVVEECRPRQAVRLQWAEAWARVPQLVPRQGPVRQRGPESAQDNLRLVLDLQLGRAEREPVLPPVPDLRPGN